MKRPRCAPTSPISPNYVHRPIILSEKQASECQRSLILFPFAFHHCFDGLENATLTTRGESPAGAGIAGSSALTIAVCGALARFTGQSGDADALLQVAMNVECQAIRVPTGVQDYRPALYGGVAAIELRVEGIKRVGIDVDAAELEELRAKIQASYEEQTDVRYAAARLWVDKILDPAETRDALLFAHRIATRHDDGREFRTGVLQV